jgi:peptide/nickel transport system substrate-binding protein
MALEAGEIDIAEGLHPDDLISLRDNPQFVVQGSQVPWICYLVYDVRNPPFDDQYVRQAISYAMNYDEIINGPERGFAERLYSVLHSTSFANAPDKYVKYNYNPDKARQLLRKSKYPDGFSTEMYYAVERRSQFDEEAVLIQGYLKDIGIDLKLRRVAFATQLELQNKGNYGMALMVYKSSSPDPESGVGWRICPDRDTGGWDATHWEDPIARNTTKGRETGDIEERIRLYQELAIKASEEAIYVPLFAFSPYFALKKNIKDFYFQTGYGPIFWEVTKQ